MTENELLYQAVIAIRAGNKELGRYILIQLVEKEPINELAWFWLATCVVTNDEKRSCLKKVLEINPENQNARKILDMLTTQVEEPSFENLSSKVQEPETKLSVADNSIPEEEKGKRNNTKNIDPINALHSANIDTVPPRINNKPIKKYYFFILLAIIILTAGYFSGKNYKVIDEIQVVATNTPLPTATFTPILFIPTSKVDTKVDTFEKEYIIAMANYLAAYTKFGNNFKNFDSSIFADAEKKDQISTSIYDLTQSTKELANLDYEDEKYKPVHDLCVKLDSEANDLSYHMAQFLVFTTIDKNEAVNSLNLAYKNIVNMNSLGNQITSETELIK
jgi:hypothetical protein